MTLSEYMRLKHDINYDVGSSERNKDLLMTLKNLFKKDINSPRRFEQITTIGELLEVLETRDTLSEDNVKPLGVIAQKLPNNTELLKKIEDYECRHVPRKYVNFYDTENIQREAIIETKVNGSNPYAPNISKVKVDRIWLTIIEEIGVYWRDLGRHLKIRERVIEDIDKQDKLLWIKAKLLLEFYEKRADPQKWFFSLCDALEKSRRKDLSKKIQDIMSMNI